MLHRNEYINSEIIQLTKNQTKTILTSKMKYPHIFLKSCKNVGANIDLSYGIMYKINKYIIQLKVYSQRNIQGSKVHGSKHV